MTISPSKFSQLHFAKTWVDNSPLSLVIMHGDDGMFWVVTGRECRKLEAQGYERAL